MNRKSSVMMVTVALALVSATSVIASDPPVWVGGTGVPGLHPNFQPWHDEGSPCDGMNTRARWDHFSYVAGGAVANSSLPGTVRANRDGTYAGQGPGIIDAAVVSPVVTQIHDECQDDGPLYMGDNEYEWGVNGAFLWTRDHGEVEGWWGGDLNHNPGPNARRRSPEHGEGWPNPHHEVDVIPVDDCFVTLGPPNTLTCGWAASSAETDACVEDMDGFTHGAAFTIGADVNGNGVVSGGYPYLEPTVFGIDPSGYGATCRSPRQAVVLDPTTGFATAAYGPTTAGEGPGYNDGTTDTDRNPTTESTLPCNGAGDGNPTNDCARPHGRGNQHGFWVFIQPTRLGDSLYASSYTRISG